MHLIIFICAIITTIHFRNSFIFKMEILYPLNSNSSFPPSSWPWQSPFYFLSLWFWWLCVSHGSGIIQCLSFCDWLTSLSIIFSPSIHVSSLVAQLVKNLPAKWETWIWFLGWEHPLEKGTATHSSILALENSMDYTVHGVGKSQTQNSPNISG